MGLVGGNKDVPLNQENSTQVEDLAKFAVEQYNSRENAQISYVGLISAQKQVVAGVMWTLKLKAESGGQIKIYQAKILEKAWLHSKTLESFENVQESSSTP